MKVAAPQSGLARQAAAHSSMLPSSSLSARSAPTSLVPCCTTPQPVQVMGRGIRLKGSRWRAALHLPRSTVPLTAAARLTRCCGLGLLHGALHHHRLCCSQLLPGPASGGLGVAPSPAGCHQRDSEAVCHVAAGTHTRFQAVDARNLLQVTSEKVDASLDGAAACRTNRGRAAGSARDSCRQLMPRATEPALRACGRERDGRLPLGLLRGRLHCRLLQGLKCHTQVVKRGTWASGASAR